MNHVVPAGDVTIGRGVNETPAMIKATVVIANRAVIALTVANAMSVANVDAGAEGAGGGGAATTVAGRRAAATIAANEMGRKDVSAVKIASAANGHSALRVSSTRTARRTVKYGRRPMRSRKYRRN
jgi:hypothetical protein